MAGKSKRKALVSLRGKVLDHALEVFGDKEKVKLWINHENRALNNMRPLQLFDTVTGLNMVNDILGRIEQGVYS